MTVLKKRNMQEKLYNGKFTTLPGDIFTIETKVNMISSHICVHVTNDGLENEASIITDERITLPNNRDAWKLLKKLSEMGGRSVLYQMGDSTPIDYKESKPYIYRFDN